MATEITEQIVREAPQIEAYKLGLLQAAKTLSEKKMELPAYEVAALTEQQKAAALLGTKESGGIGAYQPFLQAGQKSIEAGITALGQTMGAPSQTNLAAYLNPYTQNVIDATAAQMQRQGQIAQQGAAAQAVKSGAFGGTREGVQRAEMERNLQDQMANMAAQQYAQNYAQAQNLYGQQQGRTLQAGQLYGTLGVQQAALGERTATFVTRRHKHINDSWSARPSAKTGRIGCGTCHNASKNTDPVPATVLLIGHLQRSSRNTDWFNIAICSNNKPIAASGRDRNSRDFCGSRGQESWIILGLTNEKARNETRDVYCYGSQVGVQRNHVGL
jgi:hypothetical protein